MILIGSRALALRAPTILSREPLDFDFIATQHEVAAFIEERLPERIEHPKPGKIVCHVRGVPCEFELIKEGGSTAMLVELLKSDADTVETSFGLLPSLDLLFTIKKSHRFLKNSPHFWKTVQDYHKMKHVGAVVRPEYKAFLKTREEETYTYAHPKLNVGKTDFFKDDQVGYEWDHDSIHRAITELDKPAYRNFMVDEAEVMTSKKKFMGLPEKLQLLSHVEEAAVLAIERSLVPHPGAMTEKQAWTFALAKLLSSISSGWWRAWGYENVFKILKLYPEGYYERFQAGVSAGTVRPFKE